MLDFLYNAGVLEQEPWSGLPCKAFITNFSVAFIGYLSSVIFY